MKLVRMPHAAGTDPTRQCWLNVDAIGLLEPLTISVGLQRPGERFQTRITLVSGQQITVVWPLEEVLAAINAAEEAKA